MGRRTGHAVWAATRVLLPIFLAASILSLRLAPPNLPTFTSGNHRVTVQGVSSHRPCFDQDGQEIAVLPSTVEVFVPRVTAPVIVVSREHRASEIASSCYNRPPPTA